MGMLAQRHEVVAVRLVDPMELDLPDLGLIPITDLETGEQLLVDTHDKRPREILSLNGLRITLATVSRDDRQIYLSVVSPESDIQMLSLN